MRNCVECLCVGRWKLTNFYTVQWDLSRKHGWYDWWHHGRYDWRHYGWHDRRHHGWYDWRHHGWHNEPAACRTSITRWRLLRGAELGFAEHSSVHA
ncbi:hypothetical protein GCM10008941_16600 [Rhizomicrobium palustre]